MSRQVTPRKPPTDAQPFGFWKQVYRGLTTVLGAGVFVGIGVAAEVGGTGVIAALTLAALIALFNRWSAAQVAVVSPSSLQPYSVWLPFTLDWTLFLAKLMATAIATLGLAGYLLNGLHQSNSIWLIPTALIALLVLTVAALKELSNAKLLGFATIIAVIALLGLILAGLPNTEINLRNFTPSTGGATFLQATALMVVAYAGAKNSAAPNLRLAKQSLAANSFALLLVWLLYAGVAAVGITSVGATGLGRSVEADGAPLVIVMQQLALPGGVYLICLGAILTMASLIVTLLPSLADALLEFNQSATETQPQSRLALSLGLVSIGIGWMLLVGEVRTIWSFSAFALLMHAALTFWVALQQAQPRLYPRWLDGISLAACLVLAFSLEWNVWLVSLSLILLGLIWRGITHWSNEAE